MFACHINNLLQNRARVDGTGRVIRVNHHDALSALGNLRLDVFNVGVPVVFLVAEVVHGLATHQRSGGGPQRVVRHRNQNLVAGLAERLQSHRNQLRHTVTQVDGVGVQVHDAAVLVVLHDGGTCGVQAARIGVTLGFGQVANNIHHDRVRRLKTEGGGVADVQLQDAVAHRFHAVRLVQNRSANIVEDVVQSGGLTVLRHDVLLSRVIQNELRCVVIGDGVGSAGELQQEREVTRV